MAKRTAPRRRTIGRDPLAETGPGTTPSADELGVGAQVSGAASVGDNYVTGEPPAYEPPQQTATSRALALLPAPRRPANGSNRARRAIGGRIELIGGDGGRKNTWIRLIASGGEQRMGFFTADEEFVDLEQPIRSMIAWPDDEEHRVIAAIGWGWTIGGFFGVLGGTIAAGVRLLNPKRMLFELKFADGRAFVGRTDSVTTNALRELASGGARAV